MSTSTPRITDHSVSTCPTQQYTHIMHLLGESHQNALGSHLTSKSKEMGYLFQDHLGLFFLSVQQIIIYYYFHIRVMRMRLFCTIVKKINKSFFRKSLLPVETGVCIGIRNIQNFSRSCHLTCYSFLYRKPGGEC